MASRIVLSIVLLFQMSLTAGAQEQLPIHATHFYPVKFSCGASSEEFQEGVVRGVHSTSVTLYNPSTIRAVSFVKRVSRALPFQRSGENSDPVVDTLQPQMSMDIECNEIRMMLPASMSRQFRSGFLGIHATGDLSVVALYSSRPKDGDVSTIDIEQIEARRPTSDRPPSDLPDLTISDIDLRAYRVDCVGRSSCRVSVPVIVSNAGAAPSGAFDVLTVFDRAQGVEVESNLPDGLSSGASEVLVIEAETEGACFDPDCEICATADPDNDIAEADEGNNTLCREPAG